MDTMPNSTASGAPAPLVKDATAASFMADVIEASREAIVLVDFWAPWCGPCKQLGPALERVVRGAGAGVRLVRIDIDRNPDLARQMHIQSIPAVYAFHQGRPVDGFVGALPESQIKAFVDRLVALTGRRPMGAVIAEVMEHAAQALASGDIAAAEGLYADILEADPRHAGAFAGRIRCRLAAGDVNGARAVLRQVPPEIAEAPEIAAARTGIELAERRPSPDALRELEARLARNADDHQARFDLAVGLFAAGRAEEAADHLLELVRRDRAWNDEAARKQLLKIFEALGPTHPLTLSARRRLSSLLFA